MEVNLNFYYKEEKFLQGLDPSLKVLNIDNQTRISNTVKNETLIYNNFKYRYYLLHF